MLCYAWNVLAIMDDVKVGSDDYDDAYNLLSRVFSYGIGKIIRSGFHRSYIEQTDELATVRGKISVRPYQCRKGAWYVNTMNILQMMFSIKY